MAKDNARPLYEFWPMEVAVKINMDMDMDMDIDTDTDTGILDMSPYGEKMISAGDNKCQTVARGHS